ncbi:ATP-binding protein, partial [bacterium]|nr:ATP-binding protein [bacterium]
MLSPKEYIVEKIRRKEFGIGLETDADARMVINKQNERLHRALKNLSDDLYTKETHFVLELIQNAEDNNYDKGVEPYIKFIIDEDKITIENNEKGFSAENVSAICDVGKTTKTKAKGYIGEKGVGFKSVFKTSNEPHIFSNEFQFKFKHEDKNDILGFVVPYWVEELPESIDKNITTIVLPLKDEFRGELSKFDDIDATLILFLKKLKGFSFEDRV